MRKTFDLAHTYRENEEICRICFSLNVSVYHFSLALCDLGLTSEWSS